MAEKQIIGVCLGDAAGVGPEIVAKLAARNYFDEYFELTGCEFPACDRNRWNSLDEWLTDLKLAVYREQAIREVYGNVKGPQGS